MEQKIIEMLGRYTEADVGSITEDSNIYTDLNIDSPSLVALIMDCEDELGLSFDEAKLKDVQTVGDILRLLKQH